jgi:phospholipid/cholesterol/gamma-HCH transport system permease protein
MSTANWLLMLFAVATAVMRQALRPVTWRRPVRAEFWRFMDLVCLRNLAAMLVTAALVGLAVVSQGLYWFEQFGQQGAIGEVIVFVMVREIVPLIVGLLVLGSGGIVHLGELGAMRINGQLDALDRQGVDPFLLLVVPRVVAMIVAVFAHSILFIIIAFLVGYAMAQATGATAIAPAQFVINLLSAIGNNGYLVLPAKALAIGLTIGAVCSLTAMDRRAEGIAGETLTARGFIRGISGILLVSTLLSLAL